jgi:hypothetical protein
MDYSVTDSQSCLQICGTIPPPFLSKARFLRLSDAEIGPSVNSLVLPLRCFSVDEGLNADFLIFAVEQSSECSRFSSDSIG